MLTSLQTRLVIGLMLGFLFGIFTTWIYMSIERQDKLNIYASKRLKEADQLSSYTLHADPADGRNSVHGWYANQALQAYRADLISKDEYDKTIATAFTRLCIQTDSRTDSEMNRNSCEAAEKFVKKWSPDRQLSDFKEELRASRSPQIDLDINE